MSKVAIASLAVVGAAPPAEYRTALLTSSNHQERRGRAANAIVVTSHGDEWWGGRIEGSRWVMGGSDEWKLGKLGEGSFG